MNHDQHKIQAPKGPLPMSTRDFAEWGVQQVAYIKPIKGEGGTAFAVYAANGQQLGLMETRDVALAALIQNDLELFSVH